MSIVSLPQHLNSRPPGESISGAAPTTPNHSQLEMAAEQFEALFLQQVLKQMRKASDALSTDSPLRSRELDTMRDFYDGVLAETLAAKKQTGIADLLVKQLSGNAGQSASLEQASAVARSADLPSRSASLLDPLRGAWKRGVENLGSAWRSGAASFSQLVDSIIRHESAGRVDAVSPKGALGLMQLMPDTARDMAAELGIPFDQARLTTDGNYNKQLGSAYLNKMLERYDGDEALAVCAYNAGPGRVDQWLQRHGDPRRGEISRTNWVERIPFSETRNYATKILRDLDSAMAPLSAIRKADITPNADVMPKARVQFKPTPETVALSEKATHFGAEGAHQSRSAAFAQSVRIVRKENEL
jgi:soluble lytic murein transglycosylase